MLMCAFLAALLGARFEIKELGIGLAAGIIFDATVVRALLVPATMRLLGDANWSIQVDADRASYPRPLPTARIAATPTPVD